MNYYNQIKEQLINNEVYKKVKDYSKNKNDLMTYYNVGKLIIEAQGGKERAKYGNGLINQFSKKLINDINQKYNTTILKRMREFYLLVEKGATVSHQLTWSHYVDLIPLKQIDKINYYISVCEQYKLSVRELREKIKNKEYERLPSKTKNKLINKKEIIINDFIKNPIMINNNGREIVNEKVLKQLILEDIDNFLKELGDGFSYVGNEYKIKVGNNYNYIDLLLFNYIYNCFVVVELKVTELKKEHLGQIQVYMNYIDKNVKNINQDKTIGIIIVKKDNNFIMEYCSDDRIFETEYITI